MDKIIVKLFKNVINIDYIKFKTLNLSQKVNFIGVKKSKLWLLRNISFSILIKKIVVASCVKKKCVLLLARRLK